MTAPPYQGRASPSLHNFVPAGRVIHSHQSSAAAAMAEDEFSPDYPHLDTTTYSLIISGTSLPASLLAAAAASLPDHSVLHIDPNPFYGSHFSSLSPAALPPFLLSHPVLYSQISTSGSLPPAPSRFLLDLAAPRALYCADPAVDLLLRSGASHHVEFKSLDATLIYWDRGLSPIPDSRQSVFKDRSLSLSEKTVLMRFLKRVQAHVSGEDTVSEEEMELPFDEFLTRQRLPERIRAIVLYGIAMADYDQGGGEVMRTREGLESLGLYSSSIGRFPNAIGAFIYPMYGHGELSQAFCRSAAVKGALYVLRMPVVSIHMDQENGQYKGIRLASGQDIFSQKLVMDTFSTVPSSPVAPFSSDSSNISKPSGKVARGVCITRDSIQRDLSNILVVFPPRSLYPEQLTTIRALQLSSNAAVCPSGFFVVHLSTPCEDAILGKEFIHAAMSALFLPPDLGSAESGVSKTNEEDSEVEFKPTMIWSCVYVQQTTQASSNGIFTCPMPDEKFSYKDLLDSTTKMFTNMYPGEEFIPKNPVAENAEEDGNSDESN